MKLLVIVLCLLSERYLIHSFSLKRFYWFHQYCEKLISRLQAKPYLSNPFVLLITVIIPILLPVFLVMLFLNQFLFGFGELVIHLGVFYYCLGPNNPFYPVIAISNQDEQTRASIYLSRVNSELFALIFWYILFGPLGALCYRLITLSHNIIALEPAADFIQGMMDWITVRLTALFYLLAGNFQRGLPFYIKQLPSSWKNNDFFLSQGGLYAARTHEVDPVSLADAQNLMECALIIYLVFIGLFTLASWL